MSEDVPAVSPFAGVEFTSAWDGWRGRSVDVLRAGGLEIPYVKRCLAGLCARAALPFGVPVLVDDLAPERADWIRAYFALRPTLRSSLSLYAEPRLAYRDVEWVRQERMVVVLDRQWRQRVDRAVERRSRRAAEVGWQIRELTVEELAGAGACIRETDRRHGQRSLLDRTFLMRLQRRFTGSSRLRLLGAVRDRHVGAFQVVLASGDYEVGWMLYSTDRARNESVGPALMLHWLTRSSAVGVRTVDLGVSPTSGVRAFKASLGARPAALFTGRRGLHLRGV